MPELPDIVIYIEQLLAHRSLSRLLRDDWPRTLEELDELRPGPALTLTRKK